ncbi:hypothetical protein BDQ17DRAFT_1436501 [Cyathus striatus]|nr:hypothetical protein BDQ17DRAFT_1436501 [Cyathus striatus]
MSRKKRHIQQIPIHGANQHCDRPIYKELPNLAEILQGYIDSGIFLKDIPDHIKQDHGVQIAPRTVQKYMKELGILTARRNGLTADQKKHAVHLVTQDDPAGRWGGRLVKEKLAHKSIHIPRDEVLNIRRDQNPEATEARHPRTRKVHNSGIWSIGPNEEWCVDGHEKLLNCMGIAIWGVIDKFSRMELSLIAMPNARIQQIPPIIFLRLVKEKGGMPLTVTGDKGSELGLLISLVTAMRQRFQPFLPEAQLPAFRTVKSTYNITRERGWRPLWEKELANVVYEYNSGKITSGYVESDDIHSMISYWLWGQIVQERLNEVRIENQSHRIRSQKKILLPSGARRIDIYSMPEKHGGKDRLIRTKDEVINDLLNEYDRPDLLLFGTAENVAACKNIYVGIGQPKLSARVGWSIFKEMVNHHIQQYTSE